MAEDELCILNITIHIELSATDIHGQSWATFDDNVNPARAP